MQNRKQSIDQNQFQKQNRWNRDSQYLTGTGQEYQGNGPRARDDAEAAFSNARGQQSQLPPQYQSQQRPEPRWSGRTDNERDENTYDQNYGRDQPFNRDGSYGRDTLFSGGYDTDRTGNYSGPNNNIGTGMNYGAERAFGASRGLGSNSHGNTETQQYGLHYGKGPKNYKRSDARIQEDVHEALTHDHHVDASEIEVAVKDGIVTLSGTVAERRMKRLAEECIENVSGVIDVKNEISSPFSIFGSKSESKTSSSKNKSAANNSDMM